MSRYLVRCCCKPGTIYGFLDIPGDRSFRDGDKANVITGVNLTAKAFDPSAVASTDPVRNRTAEVKLRMFTDTSKNIREIAVYSDDRPIEFWRDVYGFTELKPVLSFSTRSLARELRAEGELGTRRFLTAAAGRGPLSMTEAAALARNSAASVNRTIATDVAFMSDTISRLKHPCIDLVGIVVGRDLMVGLQRHRDQQLGTPTLHTSDPGSQTFMGFDIVEDPAMPSGAFEIITDAEAYAERIREVMKRVRPEDYINRLGRP